MDVYGGFGVDGVMRDFDVVVFGNAGRFAVAQTVVESYGDGSAAVLLPYRLILQIAVFEYRNIGRLQY